MEKRIVLSERDAMRLRALIKQQTLATAQDREMLLDLREEMERAWIVDEEHLPDDAVALDSRVVVRDLETSARSVYTLVSPAHVDVAHGRVSVLAPLGIALLGYRTGDVVEWQMPGGWRRLRIEVVEQVRTSPDLPPHPDRIAA